MWSLFPLTSQAKGSLVGGGFGKVYAKTVTTGMWDQGAFDPEGAAAEGGCSHMIKLSPQVRCDVDFDVKHVLVFTESNKVAEWVKGFVASCGGWPARAIAELDKYMRRSVTKKGCLKECPAPVSPEKPDFLPGFDEQLQRDAGAVPLMECFRKGAFRWGPLGGNAMGVGQFLYSAGHDLWIMIHSVGAITSHAMALQDTPRFLETATGESMSKGDDATSFVFHLRKGQVAWVPWGEIGTPLFYPTEKKDCTEWGHIMSIPMYIKEHAQGIPAEWRNAIFTWNHNFLNTQASTRWCADKVAFNARFAESIGGAL